MSGNKYNRKKVYIHKLVYDHFGSKTAKGKFIHHVDGKETNNDISNLKKVSLEENLKARKFFYRNKDGNVTRKRKGKKSAPAAAAAPGPAKKPQPAKKPEKPAAGGSKS